MSMTEVDMPTAAAVLAEKYPGEEEQLAAERRAVEVRVGPFEQAPPRITIAPPGETFANEDDVFDVYADSLEAQSVIAEFGGMGAQAFDRTDTRIDPENGDEVVFGVVPLERGREVRVEAERKPPQQLVEETPPESGGVARGAVMSDITKGLLKGVGQGVAETADALMDLLVRTPDVGTLPDPIGLLYKGFAAIQASLIGDSQQASDELRELAAIVAPDLTNWLAEPYNFETFGGLVQGGAQFAVPAIPAAKALKALTSANALARAFGWGAIADFFAFDPMTPTIPEELIKAFEAADPEEWSAISKATMAILEKKENQPILNRLKMVPEGVLIGGLFEGAVRSPQAVRALARGAQMAARVVQERLAASVQTGKQRFAEGKSPVPVGMSIEDVGKPTGGAQGKRVGTTGQYIGAPPGTTSPQKLASIRRKMEKVAREGEPGRFWYERSGKAILDMVGGDVDEADKIAQAIAITSAGSTPVKHNFDYAMQAYAQHRAGEAILTGKFPAAMVPRLEEAFAKGGWGGRKTSTFYNNLMRHIDPSRAQGVTTDIWIMRAFGFKNADGTPYSGTPTAAQYDFVEREVIRISERLGWEPQQTQAAIWVAEKARDKGVDPAAMTFDYADAARDNLAQISWESIPSRTSGHLSEIFDAPYAQQVEYHAEVSRAFLDNDGNDLIAKELGIPSPGDFEAPGYYEGKVSPGTQTQVVAPRQYKGADYGEIEASTEDLISAYAAARGILLKQDGVGWHRPFYKAKVKDSNAFEVTIGRNLSEEETVRLADLIAEEAGHAEYAPISTPNGVRLINFDYVGIPNKEFHAIVQRSLKRMDFDGGAEYVAKRFHSYTGYADNDWTVNRNGEGYYQGRWSGRPDLQRRVRGVVEEIAPRIDDIEIDFSERYGWTRNEQLLGDYRAGEGRPPDIGAPTQPETAPPSAGFFNDDLPLTGEQRSTLLRARENTFKTKPNKIVQDLISKGLWDESLRQDAVTFLGGMRDRRAAKQELVSRGIDPLAARPPGQASQRLERKRENIERQKALESERKQEERVLAEMEDVKNLPGREMWSKTFAEQVDQYAQSGTEYFAYDLRRAINRANLEAIPRHLKKLGWTVRHASKGGGGRKSSRYLVSPDKEFQIRLSDHEIMDTPQRDYRRQELGQYESWDDEIILRGNDSPAVLVDQILKLYDGAMADR